MISDKPRFFIILCVLGGLLLSVLGYLFIGSSSVDPSTRYGVTWSKPYAESLGVDSDAGLKATLDDLGVRFFRIPIYWTEVEPAPNKFQWDEITKELNMISSRGGKAIVVVGAKQPRWPERWVPDWALSLGTEQREAAQLRYVEAVFERFAHHPALEAWQVENEPLFPFGVSHAQSRAFLKTEMRRVQELEQKTFGSHRHPVYTTGSGEWSFWSYFHNETDGIGISVYRLVLTPWGSVFHYDFVPPFFYMRKAVLVARWTKQVYVSEFQMEPWARMPLNDLSFEEQMRTFDLKQMQANFQFAERMHMPTIYFWGAEWWYWMKEKRDHPEFWQTAKTFFATHRPGA